MERSADFAELLARAQAGDADASGALARAYEPQLRRVAHALLGPALRPYLDTLDVVNSVHKSLLIGLRGGKFAFDTPEALVALATVMVRRKVARHWRKHRRQTRLEDTGPELADVLATATSPHADPVREAQYREQVHRVFALLAEADRRLLDLRLQGYSSAEIAALVALSAANVRVRLSRLRHKLQEHGVLASLL